MKQVSRFPRVSLEAIGLMKVRDIVDAVSDASDAWIQRWTQIAVPLAFGLLGPTTSVHSVNIWNSLLKSHEMFNETRRPKLEKV